MSPDSITVHSARIVVPMTAPPILDGAVAVQHGRILHVGERSWVLDQLASAGVKHIERNWRGAILPGLVNAHTHLQYTGMASVGPHSMPASTTGRRRSGPSTSGRTTGRPRRRPVPSCRSRPG